MSNTKFVYIYARSPYGENMFCIAIKNQSSPLCSVWSNRDANSNVGDQGITIEWPVCRVTLPYMDVYNNAYYLVFA